MYKVSETVLPIYINGQCPIIKTCSDVTLNLSSKDSRCNDCSARVYIIIYVYGHSRLDIPNEKLCWVYVRLPIRPHGSKNVWLSRFEIYIAKRFKIIQEVLSLYGIRLVISFFQIGCKIERLVLWMS